MKRLEGDGDAERHQQPRGPELDERREDATPARCRQPEHQCDGSKCRAPRNERGDVERQRPLQDARERPRDGGEEPVELPAPPHAPLRGP
jgi:hypothetical protein